jgi:hypothetical protein
MDFDYHKREILYFPFASGLVPDIEKTFSCKKKTYLFSGFSHPGNLKMIEIHITEYDMDFYRPEVVTPAFFYP